MYAVLQCNWEHHFGFRECLIFFNVFNAIHIQELPHNKSEMKRCMCTGDTCIFFFSQIHFPLKPNEYHFTEQKGNVYFLYGKLKATLKFGDDPKMFEWPLQKERGVKAYYITLESQATKIPKGVSHSTYMDRSTCQIHVDTDVLRGGPLDNYAKVQLNFSKREELLCDPAISEVASPTPFHSWDDC